MSPTPRAKGASSVITDQTLELNVNVGNRRGKLHGTQTKAEL